MVVLPEEGVHDSDEAARLEHQEVHPRQHPHLLQGESLESLPWQNAGMST